MIRHNQEPESSRLQRLFPVLGLGLRELLSISSLAIAGLLLGIAVRTLPPEFFGSARGNVERASGLAALAFVGVYAAWRSGSLLRSVPRAGHEETATEGEEMRTSVLPWSRKGRAARARRSAEGLVDRILLREEFMQRLEETLRVARCSHYPLSMLLLRIDGAAAGSEDRAHILEEASETILASTRETDLVGHLGDGLFGIVLPRVSFGKGQRPRQDLCQLLLDVCEESGGELRETFATAIGRENAAEFYGRAIEGLRPVELTVTGSLRRVG